MQCLNSVENELVQHILFLVLNRFHNWFPWLEEIRISGQFRVYLEQRKIILYSYIEKNRIPSKMSVAEWIANQVLVSYILKNGHKPIVFFFQHKYTCLFKIQEIKSISFITRVQLIYFEMPFSFIRNKRKTSFVQVSFYFFFWHLFSKVCW